MNLLEERKILMEDIMKLTAQTSIAELYKLVIEMLKETLSAVLKLCDHVNSKQEPNNPR